MKFMKFFQQKLRSKLQSERGESIAEVLIAALVVMFALLLLSSMLMAAKHLVEKSEVNYSANMLQKNAIELESTVSGTVNGTMETANVVKKDTEIKFTGKIQSNHPVDGKFTVSGENLQMKVDHGSLITVMECGGSTKPLTLKYSAEANSNGISSEATD